MNTLEPWIMGVLWLAAIIFCGIAAAPDENDGPDEL